MKTDAAIRRLLFFAPMVGFGAVLCAGLVCLAQQGRETVFRVHVDMVVLTYTVTDNKGNYVTGLSPSDFRILEDNIPQKIATFSEGTKPMIVLDESARDANAQVRTDETGGRAMGQGAGTNVFVLFDTSNHMYRTFSYASDSIADFVRGLDPADSIAIYTFSRNLTRVVPLGRDRGQAVEGLRLAVAGDDTALYNALLLTLRDAAAVPGRKVIVVFSNGPDNASMVSPEDVRALAEDEGVPIYLISTADATKSGASAEVFERLAGRTGGQAYVARTWKKQVEAFTAVHDALSNSYTAAYYPAPNPNEGYRKIRVEILSDDGHKYHVRARLGYRPRGGT